MSTLATQTAPETQTDAPLGRSWVEQAMNLQEQIRDLEDQLKTIRPKAVAEVEAQKTQANNILAALGVAVNITSAVKPRPGRPVAAGSTSEAIRQILTRAGSSGCTHAQISEALTRQGLKNGNAQYTIVSKLKSEGMVKKVGESFVWKGKA
jgi:hypothetical protein